MQFLKTISEKFKSKPQVSSLILQAVVLRIYRGEIQVLGLCDKKQAWKLPQALASKSGSQTRALKILLNQKLGLKQLRFWQILGTIEINQTRACLLLFQDLAGGYDLLKPPAGYRMLAWMSVSEVQNKIVNLDLKNLILLGIDKVKQSQL